MKISEMTNEELADYIVNVIGGGIFKEYYAEAAARLRKYDGIEIRMRQVFKPQFDMRDAIIEELKHWIKSAARWIKCHDIYHTSGNDLIEQAKEILNDDGEFLFKKGE